MAAQRPKAWAAPQLAQAAGMSTQQIQNILKGYRTVSAGETAPVVAKPVTVARIARALRIAPAELESAGRADAAAALRQLITADAALDERAGTTPLRRLMDIRGQIDALIEELRVGE